MHDWWFAFILNLMNVLPAKGRSLAWRGRWAARFLDQAGTNLKLSSHVNIYFPSRLACGNHVYIGYGTYLGGGDIVLDDEVIIGPYCCIVAGNHTMRDGSYRFGAYDHGSIRIGRGTWLGSHVTVTEGVSIGRGCLVAANSVVTRSVPDFTVVGGVPARNIRSVDQAHARHGS